MENFACHCANGSSQIHGIGFDMYYIPVANSDSFIINISITAMHILTASILDVSDAFQNKTFPVHEILFVGPPPYYLDWFEISYPNFPSNVY